ncbi:MAG: hypothetical protein ACREJM_01945 [Candidatus Saccharimonadales bacterium]
MQANGNLIFAANNLILGAAQTAPSFVRLYGGSTPNAGAYLQGFDSTGTFQTDLYFDPTVNGVACITSAPISGRCPSANKIVVASNGTAFGAYSNGGLSGQTAAISAVTMATPAAVQTYRFNGNVTCDSAAASATVTEHLAWTDPSSTAQALTITATCTTLGSASQADMVRVIRSKAATNVTYATTIASGPFYDVYASLEQMN